MVPHGLVFFSHPYWILQHGVVLWFSSVVSSVFFVCFIFVCLLLKRQNYLFIFLKYQNCGALFHHLLEQEVGSVLHMARWH